MCFDFDETEYGKAVLQENHAYAAFLEVVKETREFISTFSFSQFGQDSIFTRLSIIFSVSSVLDSTEKTLHSLLMSGEYGYFADINLLLRKYRDDTMFYLYLVTVSSASFHLSKEELSRHEERIRNWQANNLSDLHIGEILKFISAHPNVRSAINKYNMKAAFGAISDTLNCYVHGNGKKYYNQTPISYSKEQITEFAKTAKEHIAYITVTFVLIMGLLKPSSLMASDYIDFLDCGMTPPTDSQYLERSLRDY